MEQSGKPFIATFGQGQFGGTLKDSYIQFENATDIQVRLWMHKHFKGQWSGTYCGADALSYAVAYVPTLLATVTFAQPSNEPYGIDQYDIKTGVQTR
jgi:hypothetical protein